MIVEACTRHRDRCVRYRPAGEVVDVSRYEVALHPRHAVPKAFVEEASHA